MTDLEDYGDLQDCDDVLSGLTWMGMDGARRCRPSGLQDQVSNDGWNNSHGCIWVGIRLRRVGFMCIWGICRIFQCGGLSLVRVVCLSLGLVLLFRLLV